MNKRSLHRVGYLFMGILLVMLSACEKDINISLPPVQSQIVVEGHIETGTGAWVVLTRSTGFFATIDTSALLNSIVKNALVIVSDGLFTDTLPAIVDFNYLSTTYLPYYYKKTNPKVIGHPGGSYSLVILVDGKKLTANTTLPVPAVKLDSVWFKLNPPSDSLGFVWAHLTDPAADQNFYRWYVKRLHKDKKFLAPIGSAFNDKFINGKSFDFGYDRGMEPNSTSKDDNNAERGYFKKGDSVVVKFCSIDYDAYNFYASYEAAAVGNGNPFGSPSNVKSNIQGGLGVWAGFSTTFDTLFNKPHP
jgi:hypothetical protein